MSNNKSETITVYEDHLPGNVEYKYHKTKSGEKLEMTMWLPSNMRSGGILNEMLKKDYGTALVLPKNEHCLQISLLDMTHEEISTVAKYRASMSFWDKFKNLFV